MALILFLIFCSCSLNGEVTESSTLENSADYLPLALGKKWVLRSEAGGSPIVFEVVGRQGEAYRVKFDNPWINSELVLLPRQGKYYVTALTFNGQTSSLPADTLYFDMTAREKATWSNSIGAMTVTSRKKSVVARGRTYKDCIQIREVNKEGNNIFWVFAPDVGFVQFGEGRGAFVLDESDSDLVGGSAPRPTAAPTPESPRDTPVYISLATNPFANEPFGLGTLEARFKQAVEAGVTFIYISPKWNELEPQPHRYNFNADNLDTQISRAIAHGMPVACNIRVIDTNRRAMPSDLMGRSFDDAEVKGRLRSLLAALMPRFRNRVRWMMIGNEIDSYFINHKDEVAQYAELFSDAARAVTDAGPSIQVSASLTFNQLSSADSLLRPIANRADFLSVTYYPLNDDFTVRAPESVGRDFQYILKAARGKKILLQEVGYPSSPLNNSSEGRQAEFFAEVFRNLEACAGVCVGANFFLLADLPESMVNDFSGYYQQTHSERFKAFLGTLGMFDRNGRPKKSWGVFRARLQSMKSSHGG